LPAVRCCADPRRPDDIEPEVALVADRGLACVQPHSHLQFDTAGPAVRRQRALRRDGRRDGVAGTSEREKEGVTTLAVDFVPARSNTALAHDPAVLGVDCRIVVAQLLEQLVEPSMSENRSVTVPAGRLTPPRLTPAPSQVR
jgi:hypothetical protein